MFSLKIAYKGKNILLGKGTDSLKKIEQELNSRFPGEFPYGVVLKYQGNTINQFQQVEALATCSVNKSLKLEAEPAEAKKLDVIQEEKKSQISSAPSVPDTNAENPKKEEQNQIKPEEKKEEEKKPDVVQDTQEHIFEVNVSIDSEDSQEQAQIKVNEKQNQKILQEPAVVKEQAPIKEQTETVVVEPTQNKEQEYKQEPAAEVEEYKPEIIKCAIFGEAPKEEQKELTIKQEQKPVEQKIQEKQNKNKNYDSQIEACEEYVSIIKIEKDIRQIEPGVYECIFCRQLQFCNACENKRRLGPGSKFFKLVDVIVEKKLNEKFTQFENKILEKLSQKKEEKIQKPIQKVSQIKKEQPKKSEIKKNEHNVQMQTQKQRIRSSHIQINDLTSNKKEITLGQQINWGFTLKLKQPIKFDHKVSIIDERTAEVKEITFKNDSVVLVGPFDAINEGKFEKTYRLCFVEQDGALQLFGPKFGFSVMISKLQKKKTLTNTFRQAIQQIKKRYKIERSTEYLIEKLKELGINEENYEENKEILSDIIQTV